MKWVELQLKQRVSAFLLRYSKRYTAGKSKWTQGYYRWLAEVKMKFPVQQIVLEEYVGAVKQTEERVRGLDKEMEKNPCELELETSGGIVDGASWGAAVDCDVAGDGAR